MSEETEETGVTSSRGGEYTERMGGPRRYGPRAPEGYPSKEWHGWMVGGGVSPPRRGITTQSRDGRECTKDID